MELTKNKNTPHRNLSSFTFADQVQPSPQNEDNFRSRSIIGNMLKDGSEQPKSIQTYTFDNKIAQIHKEYEVPQFQGSTFQRKNQQYHDFLRNRKKFKKPYSDCTKFVDSLMKNKSLLRRGPFQIPIKSQHSIKEPIDNMKTQKTEFIRSKVISKKHSLTIDKIKSYQESCDKKKGFDKTLGGYYQNYHEMMKANLESKDEKRSFKNSMNRILAAEMVEYRVLQSGETMRSKGSRRTTKSKHL